MSFYIFEEARVCMMLGVYMYIYLFTRPELHGISFAWEIGNRADGDYVYAALVLRREVVMLQSELQSQIANTKRPTGPRSPY